MAENKMCIGLAQYKFINKDISFNLGQVKKAMEAGKGKVDLLCFGESFLQGFDTLSWDYERDKHIALELDSPAIRQVCDWSAAYDMAVLLGYFEKANEAIYSSCALIFDGQVQANYRRISPEWKEISEADGHYQEGHEVLDFSFKGRDFRVALCGDLWSEGWEQFATDRILLWPVYVNYSLEDWGEEEQAYAQQASQIAETVLMVNSLSDEPVSHGGTFCFEKGEISRKLAFDEESVLMVEL